MSVEEIQAEIADLSIDDLSKVIAHAVHLKSLRDPVERKLIQDRMNDKNPESWLTIEEFENRLDGN